VEGGGWRIEDGGWRFVGTQFIASAKTAKCPDGAPSVGGDGNRPVFSASRRDAKLGSKMYYHTNNMPSA